MPAEPFGVSAVICCHNAAARLRPTLEHLAAQRVPADFPWEVIVVDNASTDGTASLAESVWPANPPAPLRVVHEPRRGLQHARECGRVSAKYALISLIDDDNWVCPEWVEGMAEVFQRRPEAGACGGYSEAVCEIPPAAWFVERKRCYAVGGQGFDDEEQAGPRPLLWGAGLTLRKQAWDDLVRLGFRPWNVGRTGGRLMAGEDSELCLALRLAGWQLWYEPRLRLRHFIPANRLNWMYLRRLHRGFGATVLDPYFFELDAMQRALPSWKKTWLWVTLRELRHAVRHVPGWWRGRRGGGEGDPAVLAAEHALGRIAGLSGAAGQFQQRCRSIREAPWRGIAAPATRPETAKSVK